MSSAVVGCFRGAGAFRLMLSSASLLLALKSGCLNSQACKRRLNSCLGHQTLYTYTRAVWRLAILLIVVSHFMEVVFVQLPDEAGEIAVLEVFGEDMLGEFLVLPSRLARTMAFIRRSSVPPKQRNCRLHCPSERRSHRWGSPASCDDI